VRKRNHKLTDRQYAANPTA